MTSTVAIPPLGPSPTPQICLEWINQIIARFATVMTDKRITALRQIVAFVQLGQLTADMAITAMQRQHIVRCDEDAQTMHQFHRAFVCLSNTAPPSLPPAGSSILGSLPEMPLFELGLKRAKRLRSAGNNTTGTTTICAPVPPDTRPVYSPAMTIACVLVGIVGDELGLVCDPTEKAINRRRILGSVDSVVTVELDVTADCVDWLRTKTLDHVQSLLQTARITASHSLPKLATKPHTTPRMTATINVDRLHRLMDIPSLLSSVGCKYGSEGAGHAEVDWLGAQSKPDGIVIPIVFIVADCDATVDMPIETVVETDCSIEITDVVFDVESIELCANHGPGKIVPLWACMEVDTNRVRVPLDYVMEREVLHVDIDTNCSQILAAISRLDRVLCDGRCARRADRQTVTTSRSDMDSSDIQATIFGRKRRHVPPAKSSYTSSRPRLTMIDVLHLLIGIPDPRVRLYIDLHGLWELVIDHKLDTLAPSMMRVTARFAESRVMDSHVWQAHEKSGLMRDIPVHRMQSIRLDKTHDLYLHFGLDDLIESVHQIELSDRARETLLVYAHKYVTDMIRQTAYAATVRLSRRLIWLCGEAAVQQDPHRIRLTIRADDILVYAKRRDGRTT